MRSLSVIEAKIFKIYVYVKAGQKIGQGAVKQSRPNYSRVFIGVLVFTKNNFRSLSHTHKSQYRIKGLFRSFLILVLTDFDRTPRQTQARYLYKFNPCRRISTQLKKSRSSQSYQN